MALGAVRSAAVTLCLIVEGAEQALQFRVRQAARRRYAFSMIVTDKQPTVAERNCARLVESGRWHLAL